jgi:dienelactone hydrolase
MGAVAFSYDMVGFGDSKPFGHAFMDDELASAGLNLAGLQLWNSTRALDWLLTLPEVDSTRIACTGESGGGTQTFLLSAVDDRIAVSAPVCMVSSHFQGGCTCENVPDLRVDTDNVEFAACFAPKPQLIVGATGDWTKEIQEHGVPQIRAVYRLYGAEQNLLSVVHEAPHNYNQASRESVYTFFRKYLWHDTSAGAVKEAAFTPEKMETLSVWDAEHPRPKNTATPEEIKRYLTGAVSGQISALRPITPSQWRWSSDILQIALETQLGCAEPKSDEFSSEVAESIVNDAHGYRSQRILLSRKGSDGRTTAILLTPELQKGRPGEITVLVHPEGARGLLGEGGAPSELISALLRKGQGVLIVNPFLAGKKDEIAKRQAAAFYSTYNRTVLAERVQDILNGVAYAGTQCRHINLVGLEAAGPWVLLARPLANGVHHTAADASGWEWSGELDAHSDMWLPGATRYGGMKAYAALCAPDALFLYNHGTNLDVSWVEAAYKLDGSGDLKLSPVRATQETIAAWLVGDEGKGIQLPKIKLPRL